MSGKWNSPGQTDAEVRAFDAHMLELSTRVRPYSPELLKANDAVDNARRQGHEVKYLHLGYETWDAIQEDRGCIDRLFGLEVEVVDEDPQIIDVVTTADLRELVAA